MAKKIPRKEDKAAAAVAEELDALHPERTAVIGGRSVTVREYGFVEGTRLRVVAKPFVDALHALFKAHAVPDYEVVQDIVSEHIDLVLSLMGKAADVKPEWIEKLSGRDGELLQMMWWGVNAGFFTRAALQRIRIEQATAALLAGDGFTPPSLLTGTESKTSENTPSES